MFAPIIIKQVVRSAKRTFCRELAENALKTFVGTTVSVGATIAVNEAVKGLKNAYANRAKEGNYKCSHCGAAFSGVIGTSCNCPRCGMSFNLR